MASAIYSSRGRGASLIYTSRYSQARASGKAAANKAMVKNYWAQQREAVFSLMAARQAADNALIVNAIQAGAQARKDAAVKDAMAELKASVDILA
jgi:hypothetical protein